MVSDFWTVENGRLAIHPHPGQARAWRSEKRFIWLLAGTQGGKTCFEPPWLYREIQRKGPGDYLAVTATFPLLKLKMLPEFRRFFEHALGLATWKATEHSLLWRDGSTRIIFSSATHPQSLESATAKAAVLDEAGQDEFRLDSWEAIIRRLSLHQGRALGGTTLYNLGWLKQQVYDRWREGDPEHEVIQFESVLNPAFPQAEYDRARERLPAWKFAMFYRGEYDRPAGLIYSDYIDRYREEGGHLVHPFELPSSWPRFGGLDFGGVNTARLMVAQDPQADIFYVYSESLSGGKTTKEHVAEAKLAAAGVNMRTWHGGSHSEGQQRRDWEDAGITVYEPDVSDVEAGIDRIIALFKTFRLYVFDSCRGLRDEIGSYARVLDASGQPSEKIKDKETYHRLDALRYVGQALNRRGPRVRWL